MNPPARNRVWARLWRLPWVRRMLYEALGGALRDAEGGHTLNCGWVDGGRDLPAGVALYREAARFGGLAGRGDALEIGCGLGGGTAWWAHVLAPPRTVGVDYSRLMIRACRRLHAERGLEFRAADARRLPFAAGGFGAVLSVETSNCLPDKAAWLAEVARVTAPGGRFVWVDFFYRRDDSPNALARRDDAVARCAALWDVVADEDRTDPARRALEADSPRREALILRTVAAPLRALAHEFAGTVRSPLYRGLVEGRTCYRWAVLSRTSRSWEPAASV